MDRTLDLLRKIAQSFGNRENAIAIGLVLSQTVFGQLLDAVKNSLVWFVGAGRDGSDIILHVAVLDRPVTGNSGVVAYRIVNSEGTGAWRVGTLMDAAASYDVAAITEFLPDDADIYNVDDPEQAVQDIIGLQATAVIDAAKFFGLDSSDLDQELFF